MAKQHRTHYICQKCGQTTARWFGRCSSCEEWNTCVEERTQTTNRLDRVLPLDPTTHVRPITEISEEDHKRIPIGIGEFDRVLGGGIVPASVVLVGGDPGVGKSTLLLQMADRLACAGQRLIYVAAEESTAQIRLRAGRVGSLRDNLLLLPDTNLDHILHQLHDTGPTVVIIDSIQTIYDPELESAPGSIGQVRECAAQLVTYARTTGVPAFLVGHVTKEGTIAGPRVLEHLVDSVVYLEGERHQHFRVLRSVKNRYGSTHEIGIFEMGDDGLLEVGNPSEILLAERLKDTSGSAIVCSLEGTRPLLIEIQALVSHSSFGHPQRVVTGIDARRLSIIIAVLEKRGGYDLSSEDIFINVVGGLRLEEPSGDLGLSLAIVSSLRSCALDFKTVAIGEIGLGGEVRPVERIDHRVAEARRLGFSRCLVSQANLKGWKRPEEDDMEVIGVNSVDNAIELVL